MGRGFFFAEQRLNMKGEHMSQSSGYLSPRTIAHEADVDPQTVYRWIRLGRLPATKVGRLVRVRKTDFTAFMAGR